jgi:hypothetical protein
MTYRLIAAGLALSLLAGQASAQQAEDGGGFFEVIGIADNDLLNIRANASPAGMVIARLPNGTRLKSHGCQEVKTYRWCKVEDVNDPKLVGWAPGRYLQDTAANAAGAGQGDETAVAAVMQIPCARYYGQPMKLCQASAVRSEDGEAAVTVAWPDGGERTIRFKASKVLSADSPDPVKASREDSLHMIRIGKGERFEIPDALPSGE